MKTFHVSYGGRSFDIQADTPDQAAVAAADYAKANPLQGVDAYKADQHEFQRRADLYTERKTGKAPVAGQPTERQVVDDIFNGATLGGWGQLEAGLAAGATGAQNFVAGLTGGKKLPYGMKDAYVGQRELTNADQRQFASEHPVGSLAAGVAGGIAMPGVGFAGKLIAGKAGTAVRSLADVKGMLQSAGLLPRIVRSAAVGAGMGGVAGGLTSDPGHELEGAGRGAQTGAVVGAALPAAGAAVDLVGSKVVAPAARTVTRAANRISGGQMLDATEQASARLAEALRADGAAPDVIQSVTDTWNTTGAPPAKLLDIAANLPRGGQNTMRLLRAAASKGAGANVATKHLDQVAADLQDNAIARTRQITPETKPVAEVASGIKAERSADGKRMYPAFMDHQVPVDAELLSATSGGTGAKWLDHAATLAEAERNTPMAQEIAALGSKTPPKQISAGALDYIRRGMRDAADEHFTNGRGQLGSALKDRSKEIEASLMSVPGFDEARSTWAAHSGRLDALDEGLSILNAAPDEFAAGVEKAAPEAREAMKVGVRQAITDAIGKPAEGATGLLNRLATATNTRRNLTALLGEDEAGRYMDAIRNSIDQLKSARFISPNTGSATATRLEDDGLVHLPPTSKTGIVLAILSKLKSGATLTDEERAALVRMGTTDAGDATTALEPKLIPKAKRPAILPYFVPGVGAYAGRADH